MKQDMKNVFVGYSKKEIRLFLILLILVLALPLTVFLAKKVQDLRSRAKVTGGVATLSLSGPTNVQPGESFSVDLYLNPGGKEVSAFEAYLNYPPDKLDIVSCEIITTSFPTEIKKLCQGGNIDLAAGIAVLTPTPTQPAATVTPTTPAATATPTLTPTPMP